MQYYLLLKFIDEWIGDPYKQKYAYDGRSNVAGEFSGELIY